MSSINTKKSLICTQAWHYLGTPYIWGGDDPLAGFDCSGFIIELLKSVGIISVNSDFTAQGLWEGFIDKRVETPTGGCLCFYGDKVNNKISHVVLCLTDEECIGSNSGGSGIVSIEDAIKNNAFIKIRPINYRKDIVGFVNVFI